MVFFASAAIGMLAFGLSLLLPKPKMEINPSLEDDDDGIGISALLAVFRQSTLWPWYIVTVVNMFFVGILFGFLPVRVYALGYGPLVNGILLTAVSASYLLVQPFAGSLADRVSPALTIRLGLLAAGICIILTPFVTGPALFFVSILTGAGVGTVWTNTDALVSREAQAGKLGATMGIAGTFKEIGDMLGPLFIGLVSQAFGLTVGFVSCGVLGLISLGLIARRQVGALKETA
jgi:MFS family permease